MIAPDGGLLHCGSSTWSSIRFSDPLRHAGLVPASNVQRRKDSPEEGWTPEQVRGDGVRRLPGKTKGRQGHPPTAFVLDRAQRLLQDDRHRATVLGPARFVRAERDRAFLTIADRADPRRVDAARGIYLWVAQANHPAIRFYQRMGGVPADDELWEPPGGGQILCLRYTWLELAGLALKA